MPHFVLVSGAWNGSKCWDALVFELHEHHHTTECVIFPNPLKNATHEITYAAYKKAVTNAIEKSRTPCILVCHSMAGMIGGPLSDELSDKILHVFFVCAYIPIDGQSMRMQAVLYASPESRSAYRLSSDRCFFHLIPDKAASLFYNCSSQSTCMQALTDTHPQALAPMNEKVKWRPRSQLNHKRTYIVTCLDQMLPLASQIAIGKTLTPHWELMPLADHFPQLSQTKALAKILTKNYTVIRSKL